MTGVQTCALPISTRYENTVSGYTAFAMFNGTSNQVFKPAFLNMLKTWHANDPVSAREIARNNAIYARQGNRNPFIDRPEFVTQIWGAATVRTMAPETEVFTKDNQTVADVIDFEATSFEEKIQMEFEAEEVVKNNVDFNTYPNPSNGNFSISLVDEKAFDVEIFSVFGDKVLEKQNQNSKLEVTNLKKGIYLVKITSNDNAVLKKIVVE